MKTHRLAWAIVVPAVGIWVVPLLLLGVATAAQGQATTEAGVEVLTRGPIHEAFANMTVAEATPGVVIRRSPPGPIEELPPDQKPEGGNVSWIPGYWNWDDDRDDFIWVSGVWRDLPPGRQWVPGYWTPGQGGYQFISGFWADLAQKEVAYLPPPPEPLEAGPNSPAPGRSDVWAPGSWLWHEARYAWQPGYWVAEQPEWVWSPAHYVWTPRGYVYVPGYWDHDIVHRGVMFAPVYYEQPVYTRPSYYYSPSIIIDLGAIVTCLFAQPRYHHYYFGDYYDRRYEERGFYPWYSQQVTRYGYDPIYSNFRTQQLRQDPDWDVHIDEQYRYRREHLDARPPQTLALQINIINNQKDAAPRDFIIGKSLAEVVQSKTLPLRLTPVNMDERKQIETRGQEVRKFQLERAKMETAPAAAGKSEKAAGNAQPVRMQLPVSPVAARSTENVTGAKTPPPMPVAPKPQAAEDRGRQVKPQKEEARPEAKSPKPEAPKPEVRSQKPEPKAQPPRSETKQQRSKRKKAPSTEDNKNKKSEQR